MDQLSIEHSFLVATAVAAIRKYIPKINGLAVLIVALVLSTAIVLSEAPVFTPATVRGVLLTFIGAVGGVQLVDRWTKHRGVVLGDYDTSISGCPKCLTDRAGRHEPGCVMIGADGRGVAPPGA